MTETAHVQPSHEIQTALDGGRTRYSFFPAEEAVLRPLMDYLWSRLAMYYELRERLLGEPIPSDYAAAAAAEWSETE